MPSATHNRRRRASRAASPAHRRQAAAPRAPRGAPGEPGGAKAAAAPVLLSWALDRDGRRARASALDPADRKARAPFSCPGCGRPLIPHLGPRRARHFAHPPDNACAITKPETALHLEGKVRLLELCADAFAGRLRVELAARCPRCRRPAPVDLGGAGDAAEQEVKAGTLRPDVLVSRRGRPALALEVRVAHAVDARKEAALAKLGLTTLEIDVREEAWEESAPGGGVRVRVARTIGGPTCGACQASARADADRAGGGERATLAELEAYRARGLLGPRPGPARAGEPALTAAERRALARAFACPECGGTDLELGQALARHACPGRALRAVAWRGYDGALVELAWWRRAARPRG